MPGSLVERRLLLGAGILLALLPYMGAGFYFDDVYNSVLRGELIMRGLGLGDFIQHQMQVWAGENGRLFPLGLALTYTSWYWMGELAEARMLQLALAVANIAAFHALAQRLASRRVALLAALLLTCVFQFNPRWDGLSSFAPLNQFVLLLVFAAWSTALRAVTVPAGGAFTWGCIAASAAATLVALLTYEVAALAWAGAVAIAWMHRDRPSAKALLAAQAAIGVLWATAYLFVRFQGGSNYDGLAMGSLSGVAGTFWRQLLSAFPLAFLHNRVLDAGAPRPLLLLGLGAVFLLLWWRVLHRRGDAEEGVAPSNEALRLPVVLALLLLGVPAGLIAVSGRYQALVKYGDPYIVVYAQCFGAALLLALLVDLFLRRSRRRWAVTALAVLLAALATATVAANHTKISAKNRHYLHPRTGMEAAVGNGLIDDVPTGGVLVVDSPYMWESEGALEGGLCSAFFSHHAERKVHCISMSAYLGALGARPLDPAISFLRRIDAPGKNTIAELTSAGYRSTAELTRRGAGMIWREPAPGPVMPTTGPGFHSLESDANGQFAWAGGPAAVQLLNFGTAPQRRTVSLAIQSLTAQDLAFAGPDGSMHRATAVPGKEVALQFDLMLQPGRNLLRIQPSGAPVKLAGDPRELSFRVVRMKVQ